MTAKKFNYKKTLDWEYSKFDQINGQHPLRRDTSNSYVEYDVRKRKHAKIAYFNFQLAREMGLIAEDHPDVIPADLKRKLIETFSLIIINEYDIENDTKFKKEELKENSYFATRYLQLQHPGKTGKTSGDGRSMWNGYVSHKGRCWDVSSCGTGATCLSPATAKYKKNFQSGDPAISYGCGYSDISDGINAALLSEVFHHNNIKTERTLLILEYPDSYSINVRAGENLIRPSHLFMHLKQNHHEDLKKMVDYYISREKKNHSWPPKMATNNEYDHLLELMIDRFAWVSALFEVEYIFCWLDWDGDNILMDGGIIDYGSVRLFGLYHYKYRYDDVERWSTSLSEQKSKARYTVQTFEQLIDYLKSKKRKNIEKFSKGYAVKKFDKLYEIYLRRLTLQKTGFSKKEIDFLCLDHMSKVKRFQYCYRQLEKIVTSYGPIKLADGENHVPIYSLKKCCMELPHFMGEKAVVLPNEIFLELLKTEQMVAEDINLNSSRLELFKVFQQVYVEMIIAVTSFNKTTEKHQLKNLAERAKNQNNLNRLTGDAVLLITEKIRNEYSDLPADQLYAVFQKFVQGQKFSGVKSHKKKYDIKKRGKKLLEAMEFYVKKCREGI